MIIPQKSSILFSYTGRASISMLKLIQLAVEVICYLANFCPEVTKEQKEHVRTKKNRKEITRKGIHSF